MSYKTVVKISNSQLTMYKQNDILKRIATNTCTNVIHNKIHQYNGFMGEVLTTPHCKHLRCCETYHKASDLSFGTKVRGRL
jgi:hypothetical protein